MTRRLFSGIPERRFSFQSIALWISVVTASSLGGWLAHLAGLPLAYLTGALFISAAFSFAGTDISIARVRPYALVVLGLTLGQSFTPEILRSVFANIGLISACGMLTLLMGLAGIRLFTRLAGLDAKTAFFCAIPGGVVLMAIHAQRAGAQEPEVALSQTIRLVVVVLIYPTLVSLLPSGTLAPPQIGVLPDLPLLTMIVVTVCYFLLGLSVAWIGRASRIIPNPWMICPCLLSVALAGWDLQPVAMPHELIIFCQIVLGISLGSQMKRQFLLRAGPLVIASMLSVVQLTVVMVPMAWIIARISGLDTASVLLGMAPGGMPEMTITAAALGASVPMVLSFHLVRILIGNFCIEPLWRVARRTRWFSPAID